MALPLLAARGIHQREPEGHVGEVSSTVSGAFGSADSPLASPRTAITYLGEPWPVFPCVLTRYAQGRGLLADRLDDEAGAARVRREGFEHGPGPVRNGAQ